MLPPAALPPYLIVARTAPQGSRWTQAEFEADYRDNHLPRNVHHIDGIHTGLRYTNTINNDNNNGSGSRDRDRHNNATMLALYTLSDTSVIGGTESQARRREHIEAGVVSDVRLYVKVNEFEFSVGAALPPSNGEAVSTYEGKAQVQTDAVALGGTVYGGLLVSARYNDANDDSTVHDASMEFWHKSVKVMSLMRGYRRSTCWEVTDGGGKVSTAGAQRYLVLHEFDGEENEEEGAVQCNLSDIADKVLVEDMWRLVQVEGARERL